MESIHEIISQYESIAIGGHTRPDGDCIGSCLALYNYIEDNYLNKKVRVYLESAPLSFSYLSGFENICVDSEESETYEVFISMDASDTERLGAFKHYFQQAPKTVCIDHHITNEGFADINHIVPKASSTAETLFYLMDLDKISKNTAECLYTGIIHDTGVFKYSNTSKKTMEAAGKLIEMGVASTRIIDDSFYRKTYLQNQILGRALMESILLLDGRCIISGVRQKDMDFYGVTNKDLDGIVEQLRITQGVECAVFIYEQGPQEYKVSMRSNTFVDVSKIASYFGGGGHWMAAGCTMHGTMYDVINNLSKLIEQQLNREKI